MSLRLLAVSEIPVWIAANSPKTLKLTGEIADGWMPYDLDPITYKTESSTPGRYRNSSQFIYEPSEEEIRIINEYSKIDIELYNKALQKFEKDCAAAGV